MVYKITKMKAVVSLFDKNSYKSIEENGTVQWTNGHTTTPEEVSQINTEYERLVAEYDAQEYARNRQKEYPSIESLVVGLYDTDDKSTIEAKRAAVKTKYPKPE